MGMNSTKCVHRVIPLSARYGDVDSCICACKESGLKSMDSLGNGPGQRRPTSLFTTLVSVF